MISQQKKDLKNFKQKQHLSYQVFRYQQIQQKCKQEMISNFWKPFEELVKKDNNSNESKLQENQLNQTQWTDQSKDQNIFSEKEQLLYCKICKISFLYQNLALYHQKHIHNDTSNITQCDYCQRLYFGQKRKLSHQFRHHRKEMREKIKQAKQQNHSQTNGDQKI